ncbi:chemotaxis protein CheY [Skermanella aerolata KACC 11604]|nr:chemotaxis protein CheY [Skermanella aerolata KACC 11604]
MRVLIVDDSAFMRASLRHIVGNTPGFVVAGEATDGLTGVDAIRSLRPDIVTLDIDMPGLDGIGVLKRVRASAAGPPVFIMVSAFTTQGASLTVTALSCGAIDFVPKASEHFKTDLAQVGELLRSKLAIAAAILTGRDRPPMRPAAQIPAAISQPAAPAQSLPPARRSSAAGAPDVVVIASSTGGPQTLPQVLGPACPFKAPIVIAQHIPPVFSRSLADSLAATLGVAVVEAEDGRELSPNTVYLLPGGRNGELVRVRAGVFALRLLDEGTAVYRPNADILFRSAALSARRPVGLILTGMGTDGTEGARALSQRGCPVLVQDPASAVIWGMPRSAIDAGLATEVLDAPGLGQRLAAMVEKSG